MDSHRLPTHDVFWPGRAIIDPRVSWTGLNSLRVTFTTIKLIGWGVLLLSFFVSGSAASIAGSRNSANWALANLKERSNRELKSASRALLSAVLAYRSGDGARLVEMVPAVERGVDRAYEFLVQTGENPRDSPATFKQAEIHLRRLCRRLEFFQAEVSIQDRSVLETVTVKIEKLQHELLIGIASGTNLKRMEVPTEF